MITIINAATQVGESEPITITLGSEKGQTAHSFQIVSTGSPTSITISVHGSIDGLNFTNLLTHTLGQNDIIHLVNKATPKIKVSIDDITGGVSPEVSVYYFKGMI